MRRRFGLQIALGLLFVGLLAWRVNLGEALRTFGDVDYRWVVGALAVFSLSKFVHTVRWRVFLGHVRGLPVWGLFGIFLIHNMLNNLMPLRVGDLARIQIAAKRYNLPRAELTATVIVVETLLDGVTFIVLLFVAFLFQDIPGLRVNLLWGLSTLVLLGIILTMLAARLNLPANLAETPWGRRLPRRAREGIASLVPSFVQGLAALRHGRLTFQAVVVSFAAWLIEVVVFWLFGQAFGLGLPFYSYIAITIAANMVVSLPLTPTSLGLYEFSMQEVVALFGVDRPVAAGYAISTHIFISLWVILTGLVAVRLLKLRFEEILYLRR